MISLLLDGIPLIFRNFSRFCDENILPNGPFTLEVKNDRPSVSLFGTQQMFDIVVLQIILE